MEREELIARVASYERWHYAIPLAEGVTTPIFEAAHAVRHSQRRASFFLPVVRWLGGLQGARVLDLGCNAGFWMLEAIEAGAAFVQGMDGRAMHVEQAKLVLDARGIGAEHASVEQADVTLVELGEGWDLVLCLGLLYHVEDPLELVRRVAATGAEVLVFDTEVHPSVGLRGRLGREDLGDPRSSTVGSRIRVPTTLSIARLLQELGYETLVIRPRFSDWTGSEDYRGGWRRTIVASRGRSLRELEVEVDAVGSPSRELVRWTRWMWSRLSARAVRQP